MMKIGRDLYLQAWRDCLESLADEVIVPEWCEYEEDIAVRIYEENYDSL